MGADEREREASTGKAQVGDETVRVTVTMTRGQHRALKRAARDEGLTASGLVREWMIRESDDDG